MGCDLAKHQYRDKVQRFQSTHPYGVRPVAADRDAISVEFQSTHPYGVRHNSARLHQVFTLCFNPRTHMGCDYVRSFAFPSYLQFQSTHPYGVRHSVKTLGLAPCLFQSTHPYGVRPWDCSTSYQHPYVSIHAPIWGATYYMLINLGIWVVSIHAPIWGAT